MLIVVSFQLNKPLLYAFVEAADHVFTLFDFLHNPSYPYTITPTITATSSTIQPTQAK
jgi:hypothetical protein